MASDGNEEEIMHREVTEDEVVVDAAASPATRTEETDGEQSSVDETEVGDDPRGFTTAGGLMGRHRLSAAVSRLEQEILSLQEELEEVEGQLRPSSAACEQLANRVASVPDALLPVTCGPKGVAWDRWFQRVHEGKAGGESSRSGGGGGGGQRQGLGRRWWMQGRRFLPSSSGEGRVEALAE